jgi:hypothetical protein
MRRSEPSCVISPVSPPPIARTTPPSGRSWKSLEFTPEVQVVTALRPDHWMR